MADKILRNDYLLLDAMFLYFISLLLLYFVGRNSIIRRQLYSEFSLPGAGVLWQWQGDNKIDWHCYSLDIAVVLEQAQHSGVHTVDLDRPPHYLPYIVQLLPMLQIRNGTGFTRRIRRVDTKAQFGPYLRTTDDTASLHNAAATNIPNSFQFQLPTTVSHNFGCNFRHQPMNSSWISSQNVAGSPLNVANRDFSFIPPSHSALTSNQNIGLPGSLNSGVGTGAQFSAPGIQSSNSDNPIRLPTSANAANPVRLVSGNKMSRVRASAQKRERKLKTPRYSSVYDSHFISYYTPDLATAYERG